MPKLVDHDVRREEIVAIAWRVIARRGLRHTTLRDVAEEAGFANGALKRYFATKDALLQATFEFVYNSTNERIDAVTEGLQGRSALLAFAAEVLPLTDVARDEARVVLEFWSAAVHMPELADINATAMSAWRARISRWLVEETSAEDAFDGSMGNSDQAARAIVAFLLGAQVTATIDEHPADAGADLRQQFTALLHAWTASRRAAVI